MDAYRLQERRWLETHESLQGLLYEVVVPIVIYTGERTWQAPTSFRDLTKGGEAFSAFIPSTEPLFLSLPAQAEQELVDNGGAFGTALYVLQQRHADIDDFHRLLRQAVPTIERHVHKDKHRLLELLSYLTALVYHFWNDKERDSLRNDLERSIQSHAVRKDIHSMGRTIAEAIRNEGKLEGNLEAKKDTLLRQLRRKFGKKVTPALVAKIEKTRDLAILDEWLEKFVDAATLEEVCIPAKN